LEAVDMSNNSNSTGSGFGIGAVIAAVLSYTTWHSIGWAILHTLFGWAYVIYWMIFYWD